MEKEILEFIDKNVELFYSQTARISENKVLKTKDAKNIFNKTINKISEGFNFQSTKLIWKFFPFTQDIEEIKKRQEFFKLITATNTDFLKQINPPKKIWKPRYGIVVVTEDDKSFLELQKLNCPVKIISSEQDLTDLENYDIVQAVDCEDCKQVLETLPQSVFLDSVEEAYLERFLEQLSGWTNNLNILHQNNTNPAISNIINQLSPLLEIIKNQEKEKLTREKVEKAVE